MEHNKIKWNWGWGIAVAYSGFALMMVVLVVKASSQDFSLVSKDYYEQEVKYQAHLEKANNNNDLTIKPNITLSNQKISIQFPEKLGKATGNILLYRPSDARKDKTIEVAVDNQNLQQISTEGFAKGNWKIQINWTVNGIEYFDEHNLLIP